MSKKTIKVTMLTLACLSLAAMASASDLWLHVRVEEQGGQSVRVNLPLSLVEAAIPIIREHADHHGHMTIKDADLDIEDLRAVWQQLQASPDMTFVTVEGNGEHVRVAKDAGYLVVHADQDDEKVKVRMPMQVVEAILSGSGDEIDLEAAIRALVAAGEGELVTVTGDDDTVHVWVDGKSEAE